jgi:DNA-binding XRE family transcriptional regulator
VILGLFLINVVIIWNNVINPFPQQPTWRSKMTLEQQALAKLTEVQRETIYELIIAMSKHPSISIFRAIEDALHLQCPYVKKDKTTILDSLRYYNKIRKNQ